MQKKNILVGIVMVIAVIALASLSEVMKIKYADKVAAQVGQVETVDSVEDFGQGNIDTIKPGANIASIAFVYQSTLKKYEGKTIEIDNNCKVLPANLKIKNNTTIMIDNRSAVGRNIEISTKFQVKGYSFKIVKITSTPGDLAVQCDHHENVAKITIQK